MCVTIPSLVPLPRLELGSPLPSITFWVWRVYQFLHKGVLFEPMVGLEPTAYWLQISCTTIVLHWQKSKKTIQTVAITILKKWLAHPDSNWKRNCQKVVCYRYTIGQLKILLLWRKRDSNPHSHYWPEDFLTTVALYEPTYRFTFSFLSWIHSCLYCCPKEGLGFTHTYEVSLRRISHLPCYFIVTLLYLGTAISCCGMDYFFTSLKFLQVRCKYSLFDYSDSVIHLTRYVH